MLTLLALGACTWNLPSGGYNSWDAPLWDADIVSAADGVYVTLPASEQLVRVLPDGTWSAVDMNGAGPDQVTLAPDQETLLVATSWTTCRDDDPDIVYVEDCRSEDRDTAYELDVVRDGAVAFATDEVPPQYNAWAFSSDGTLAVAYLDFSADEEIDVSGVLNLTEAVFLNLDSEEVHRVPVNFAPENVLFSNDGSTALVMSRSKVAVVALTGDDAWSVTVTFPLSLDVDQEVDPGSAVLVSDDADETDYALVTVTGRSELYVLDLTDESIDIVELDGVPADLFVDEVTNHTLISYGARPAVDVLDHELFELESYDLDEACNRMDGRDGRVVLYNEDGRNLHDVYVFDTTARTLLEMRAENPILDMHLTDDGLWGVATMQPESGGGQDASGFYDQYYGIGVFDLAEDGADPVALVLEGQPLGLELTVDDGQDYALALIEGVDGLQKIALQGAQATEILLEEPPLGIDAMPDGSFVVTHDNPLGLLTFVDASTGALQTAANFAVDGLLDRPVLPRRGEE